MNGLFGAQLEVIAYYAERLSEPSIEMALSQFRAIRQSRPNHYPDYVGVVAEGEGTIEAKMALHDAIVGGQDHRSVAEGIGIVAADRAFWVFSTVAADPSAMKTHPAFVLDFCAGAVVATRKASTRGRKPKGYLDHSAIRKVWCRHLPAMWDMWRTHGNPWAPEMVSAFQEWLALADRYGLPEKDALAILDRDVLRQIAKLKDRCDPIAMRHVTGSVVAHYLPLLRWYQVFARNDAVREEIMRFPSAGEDAPRAPEASWGAVEPADVVSEIVATASDHETAPTTPPLEFEGIVSNGEDFDAGLRGRVDPDETEPGPGSTSLDVASPCDEAGRLTSIPECRGRLSVFLGDVVMMEMEDTGELPNARMIAEIADRLVAGRQPCAISIRVGPGMVSYAVRLGFEMVRRDRGVDVLADGASLRLRPAPAWKIS